MTEMNNHPLIRAKAKELITRFGITELPVNPFEIAHKLDIQTCAKFLTGKFLTCFFLLIQTWKNTLPVCRLSPRHLPQRAASTILQLGAS